MVAAAMGRLWVRGANQAVAQKEGEVDLDCWV
jgi:hypothetical protein